MKKGGVVQGKDQSSLAIGLKSIEGADALAVTFSERHGRVLDVFRPAQVKKRFFNETNEEG
ncbi:MAG: hypothetical protein OHK005_21400 [Candidatus Methylacidiphilales bacterium]